MARRALRYATVSALPQGGPRLVLEEEQYHQLTLGFCETQEYTEIDVSMNPDQSLFCHSAGRLKCFHLYGLKGNAIAF